MARQDLIDDLVRKALFFDRLREMGMIGSSGKLANAEACRRNSWIRTRMKELGVDSKELHSLKQIAISEGELY